MATTYIHNFISQGTVKEIIEAIEKDPGLISVKDERGMTLLHQVAAANGDRADLVFALLSHGANPNAKDNDDWTPLDWADFFINRDVILLLEGVTID